MAKVEILLAYRDGRWRLVEYGTEDKARAVVADFGHATSIQSVIDEEGGTLVVTVPTLDGETGAERLAKMADAAGMPARVR